MRGLDVGMIQWEGEDPRGLQLNWHQCPQMEGEEGRSSRGGGRGTRDHSAIDTVRGMCST